MTKDDRVSQNQLRGQGGHSEDGLGPNSDIGSRLRALYSAIQDEGIPPQLLDLLDRLESAELTQQAKDAAREKE